MLPSAEAHDGNFLRLSVVIVTAVVVALCATLHWQTRELSRHQDWVRHSYEVQVELERLDSALREAESIQRVMLLVGEEMTGALRSDFTRSVKLPRQHASILKTLVSDNSTQTALVAELERSLDKRLTGLLQNAAEFRSLEPNQRDGKLAEGVRETAKIERQLDGVRLSELKLLNERAEIVRGAGQRLLMLATGGSVLALTVLIMTLFLARRNRRLNLRYQRRLAEARDSALDSVKTTSNFVASVSHEIRTPMNGVLGAADLLIHDGRLDRGQRELVETIRTSGESLLDLINDILDLSKLQAGKMEFAREEFSISEVLDETLALFADAAGRKRLEMTYRVAAEVPRRVRGDARRLRQVLINLVGNAVKFTDRGSVQVEVISRPMQDDRPVLTFRVSDTGPGLSTEEQEGLFQPFSQVNPALNNGHSGTGLGLAICREIVQRLGGTLGVESRVGEGAAFWFTVRLFPAEVQGDAARLCRGGTLLLIEGQRQTALAIEQHVHGWGMKVELADHLAVLRTWNPISDLCAIVIGQPLGGSWKEAAAVVAERLKQVAAPCFLLAQPHEAISPEELKAAGIHARLRFPFRPSDLYNLLAEDTLPPPEPQETMLPPANVLLVEDNPINQRVFTRQLELLGMQVAICSDGHEGVEARRIGSFDVVLMDCQLPTMDGFEATRRIREWERETSAKHVPIIAVTAHVMPGDAEACYQAGMDDYLAKPFDLAKLRRALGRWLAPGEVSAIPADPQPVEAPHFNETQFSQCSFGSADEDRDLLDQALAEAAARLVEMRAALKSQDDEQWRRGAHRGAGSCGMVGFDRLAGLFRQAEHDAGELAPREELLKEVVSAVEEAGSAVERFLPLTA